jgi:aconitate hydratase
MSPAAAGEPYYVKMPKIMGIKLIGKLPNWVSAKDIVLEMLRRYNVTGGRGYILEYYGPGLKRSAHGIVMSSLIWVPN